MSGVDINSVLAGLINTASFPGMIERGNLDLTKRPQVKNPDGSVSTVRTMSINVDGKEVLIPTVIGDKVVSDEEAIKHFEKTGEHLGIFDTPENATNYAQTLHREQDIAYGNYNLGNEFNNMLTLIMGN